MANRTLAQRFPGQPLVEIAVVELVFPPGDRRSGRTEQFTTQGQFCLTVAMGEKAIMSDALETGWQDMEEETTNELVGLKRHRLVLVVVAIVLPAECDRALVDVQQPIVGNGDAMRIASQVAQDLFGSTEGWLGVHDPLGTAKGILILCKGFGILKVLQGGKEPESARRRRRPVDV